VSLSSRSRQISIVLPCFNEARRLPGTLDEVIEFCRREFEQFEIIVVDDGSSDDTLRAAQFRDEVRTIANGVNRGKGEAVRRGMLAARLDPVLFSDADLSTPIAEAMGLLGALEAGADIAIADRRARGEKIVRRTLVRRVVAWTFRRFVRLVALRGIDDTQCGFKMFRRDVAHRIFPMQKLGGWAFDVELLFLAQRLGYRIVSVPVEWHESEESRLTIWSPLQMALDVLKIRCLHRGLSRRRQTAASEREALARAASAGGGERPDP